MKSSSIIANVSAANNGPHLLRRLILVGSGPESQLGWAKVTTLRTSARLSDLGHRVLESDGAYQFR